MVKPHILTLKRACNRIFVRAYVGTLCGRIEAKLHHGDAHIRNLRWGLTKTFNLFGPYFRSNFTRKTLIIPLEMTLLRACNRRLHFRWGLGCCVHNPKGCDASRAGHLASSQPFGLWVVCCSVGDDAKRIASRSDA